MKKASTAIAVAVACACTAAISTPASAAITLADLTFWVGAAPGPDVHQAVLVIDFGHAGAPATAPSLAWGYRWPGDQERTGQDMVLAVMAADPRLSATGLEFGFIDTLGYDADLDGMIDFGHPGFDPGTGRYSRYWVNNEVIEGRPPFFTDAGHVMPPNGNPYAEEAPGTWIVSSTGIAGRPLADGSWDGWIFAADGGAPPRVPMAAPVPEPGVLSLLMLAGLLWGRQARTIKE